MKIRRWPVWILMGLVFIAGLGLKGFLLLQPRPNPGSGPFSPLARLAYPPRPANAEATLVAALADPDPGVRRTAVWALDRIGSTSPALVRALAEILESTTQREHHENRRDPEQVDTPWALKRIKPPAAVIAPLLRKAMASPDRWTRSKAAEVLSEAASRPGSPPDPTLATLLLLALQDPEASVRIPAPEALARLDGNTRRRAVAVLLGQLQGPDRPGQLLAAIGLARFDPEGGAAASILAARLSKGDVATRIADLYLLGRLGPVARPAVPAIVRAMTASDAGEYAFFPLNTFLPGQGSSQVTEVGRLLDDGSTPQQRSNLRPMGVVVLGMIGLEADRQALEILAGMLRVEEESRRLAAADALGAFGSRASGAIPALIELAERGDLARPRDGSPAAYRITSALEQVAQGDDPRLVAALVRMMRSGDPDKRSGAAVSLGRLAPPAPLAVPVLIGALKDPTQSVRFSASEALGRYEGPEFEAAIPALLGALEDEDGWVRLHAAGSLARHGAGVDRAVPVLVRLLRGENPSMRGFAAEGLGALGPAAGPAISALQEARHDAVKFVRDSAEEALKRIAPPEAAKAVE